MSAADYRSLRCLHDGFTLKKLPPDMDPRGPEERAALKRAYTAYAWRKLQSTPAAALLPRLARNVILFGSAAK